MIACPSIVLVAWLQTPPAPPPQSPPQPPPAAAADATKYEFPTALAPGDARLIEIKSTTSASYHFEFDGKPDDSKMHEESTTILVDTLLDPKTQPADHLWSGARRIVRAAAMQDGVVADPEWNGIDADVWTDGKEIRFQLRGDRALHAHSVDDLLHGLEAFGLGQGVALPANAAIGDEFDIAFGTLSPWCMGTTGTITKGVAHLRFESVDPKTNLARLRGKSEVEESFDKSADQLGALFGLKGKGHYEGDVALDYDVAAHRIARIVSRGKATIDGDGAAGAPIKMHMEGVYDSTITSRTGAVVTNALKEKPQFRDVPHELKQSGVSITLPSHFTRTKPESPKVNTFQSILHGVKSFAQVSVFAEPSRSLAPKEFGEEYRKAFLDGLKGSTAKDAKASGGLGAASAFEYTTGDVHGLLAIFPKDAASYVVVICLAPEAAWTENSKDWSRFLQSMKKLPAK